MIRLFLFILLTKMTDVNPFKVVGWFNGDYDDIKNIPFDKYTHIVTGSPTTYKNGTVECNLDDNITQTIIKLAHDNNDYVQWRGNFPGVILDWRDNSSVMENYVSSLPIAMEKCNIDGIEFDYEWGDRFLNKIGIITPYMSNTYTDFLEYVKKSVGNKLVSIEIGAWGCCCQGCGYPLGVLPWVNVTRFNDGAFDFINIMSYHNQYFENLLYWESDYYFLKDIWKYNISKVNLAIAYFSMNASYFKIHSEPIWAHLSKICPNIDPNLNICDNVPITGKKLNYEIGAYAKKMGFGGLFPWTINYDSFEYNNTLIDWAIAGVNSVK